MMQEEQTHCGGNMTESERSVESMKNAIQKVALRLTKDCSIGFIEISHGNHGLQSAEELTKSASKAFLRF